MVSQVFQEDLDVPGLMAQKEREASPVLEASQDHKVIYHLNYVFIDNTILWYQLIQ